MVYATKPKTLEELRDQIEHAINDTSLAIIQTVFRSVRCCFQECMVAEVEILNMYGLKVV